MGTTSWHLTSDISTSRDSPIRGDVLRVVVNIIARRDHSEANSATSVPITPSTPV